MLITSNRYIDNRYNEYLSYKLKNGIQCHIQPQVFFSCPQIIDTLTKDLNACLNLLPSNLSFLIRRIPIYINASYQFGPMDQPNIVSHTTAHHSHIWLETMYDIPAKSKSIEIYNASEYIQMRRHWNGCGLILHELCHLIHQLVLPQGLNNETVLEAFGNILRLEKYSEVYRRDWGYTRDDMDCAYATINHKEFFAELSVAYWCRGFDVYLKRQASDMNTLESVSPPFMALDVLQRQRLVPSARADYEIYNAYKDSLNWNEQLENFLTGGRAFGAGHCNKFYPFCCQQFREFDPETFDVFQQLWTFIGQWRDPFVYGHSDQLKHDSNCMGFLSLCSDRKTAENAFLENKHEDNVKDERNQTMDESTTAGDSINSDVIVTMVDS